MDACRLISIHAPIVGCDTLVNVLTTPPPNFNPRTHRGVRRICSIRKRLIHRFQSTHPSWGATTGAPFNGLNPSNFNPRTHRGVRHIIHFIADTFCHFNPRTHRGVRLFCATLLTVLCTISIHAPIVGCDVRQALHVCIQIISIHAPIVGCDPYRKSKEMD